MSEQDNPTRWINAVALIALLLVGVGLVAIAVRLALPKSDQPAEIE